MHALYTRVNDGYHISLSVGTLSYKLLDLVDSLLINVLQILKQKYIKINILEEQ